LDEGGVAAAVEQQDHLLASLEAQPHRVDQLRRQHVLPPPPTRSSPAPAWVAGWRRGGALAPARGWGGAGAASHVDHSYRRQRPALDALRQLEQPELARLHVV